MQENFDTIQNYLELKNVTLVAVSKTKSAEEIMQLNKKGQRDFGENRVQELKEKYEVLPKDIRWHLIGHLQKNKVKYITEWVCMIHSVDSLDLLTEIDKQAKKHNRIVSCLLQLYIAKEETKFGLDEQELDDLLNSPRRKELENVRIEGLMGMATNTDDETIVRDEFKNLKRIFSNVKEKYFADDSSFRHLSMGMSSDFKIAVEEGSTMVRIGSLLFGTRN
ncbi:MAG: YggS family pyridoxal phosphate-dependent enzyme [Chitinophagales bacterium]